MRVLAQRLIAGPGYALAPQLIVEPIIAQGKLVRVLPDLITGGTDLGLQNSLHEPPAGAACGSGLRLISLEKWASGDDGTVQAMPAD